MRREHSFNNKYDVIYIDQPISVGFSTANITSKICGTNACAARHMGIFVNKFFMKHQEYKYRDFYIFGESYGGSYVPVIAEYIYKEQNPVINLKGIGIGDGWTDPYWQIQTFPFYAYENKLINQFEFISSSICIGITRILIKLGFTNEAEVLMHESDGLCFRLIHGYPPKFNPYNIANPKYPPYGDKTVEILNNPKIKKVLGVSDREYVIYSMDVQNNYEKGDLIKSFSSSLEFLMERVKVILYTGKLDFICNYMSQEQYINKLNWPSLKYFRNINYSDWKLNNGTVVGSVKKYENFVFLIINDAGHYVPRDQPEAALKMLDDFIGNHF
jgi:carboxypeptidase C (cathepsin A)